MDTCNFVVMSKGGVGKSYVSWLLAQYALAHERVLYCADVDPTNATFAQYPAFGAEHINICTPEMAIDRRKFDGLTENLANHDGFCVIDTGSPSFVPLMSYVTQNRIFDLLSKLGRKVIVHTPIAGGPAMQETLLGLQSILEWSNVEIVIWENEFFGPVSIEGKKVIDTNIYKKYQSRIRAVITLRAQPEDTFGVDIRQLLGQKRTLDESKAAGFNIVAQQRMHDFRDDVFQQLEKAGL
jgi:hypothetical protein